MEYQSLLFGILALVRSAITKEKAVLPPDFDYKTAYHIGLRHQIVSMMYYGIKNSDIVPPDEIGNEMFQMTVQMLMRSENQMMEIGKILEIFEQNGIDYMPLKGILLKHLYPSADLRIMGDADILIRMEQYPSIRSLMIQLGYTDIKETEHELVWDKPGMLHLELHKRLISTLNKDYYAYFGDGWQFAKLADGSSFRYELSDEDQFIYLFTHFSKHYRYAGIGIKHVVDLWVYTRHYQNLDLQYIEAELEKLQLLQFYKNIRRLISVWFEDAENDDITDLISLVIFNSGSFGTYESKLASEMVRAIKSTGSFKKANISKIWKLTFPDYSTMCKKYPVLHRMSFLLPVMWVVRWFNVALLKRDNIRKLTKDLQFTNEELVTDYQSLLNTVGLDFNFQ